MVTEKNTIKAEFSDIKTLNKVLWQKYFIISIILLAVGVAGVLAYIVLSTVWETLYDYSPAWCEALLGFAAPLGVGLVFTLTFRSAFKNVKKATPKRDEYEFFADCFVLRTYENGGETSVERLEYNRIVKAKQKAQFILIKYLGVGTYLAIDKTTLSEEELNTLKKLLRIEIPQSASIVTLASFAESGEDIALPDSARKEEN